MAKKKAATKATSEGSQPTLPNVLKAVKSLVDAYDETDDNAGLCIEGKKLIEHLAKISKVTRKKKNFDITFTSVDFTNLQLPPDFNAEIDDLPKGWNLAIINEKGEVVDNANNYYISDITRV